MKTLIEVKIEPCGGMVVRSLKGRYKHHVVEFSNRFDHYENGRAVYSKYVHTINEQGSGTVSILYVAVNDEGYFAGIATFITTLAFLMTWGASLIVYLIMR